MAEREERNEDILRRYEDFRGKLERFRRNFEVSRRNCLASRDRLEEDYRVSRLDDETRIMTNQMALWEARMYLDAQGSLADPDGSVREEILRRQIEIYGETFDSEKARATQFAARIGQLQAVEAELENCERKLEKLRSIEDRYMRIMRERCIGPYSPWLAALDGEYEYLSESSDDEAKVKQRCSRCVCQ